MFLIFRIPMIFYEDYLRNKKNLFSFFINPHYSSIIALPKARKKSPMKAIDFLNHFLDQAHWIDGDQTVDLVLA